MCLVGDDWVNFLDFASVEIRDSVHSVSYSATDQSRKSETTSERINHVAQDGKCVTLMSQTLECIDQLRAVCLK